MKSFGKYDSDPYADRFSDHIRNSRYSVCNSTHSTFHPRRRICKRFFITPHLRITGITSYPQKIVFVNEDKKEEFDCIVWCLKMKNKYSRISKNVNNCTAKIYFHTIQQELPLKWRSSMEAYWDRNHYVDSSSNTNFNPRNEFLTQLGIKAAFSLHSRGSESVDIPPNAENELFFDYIQGRRVLPHLIILSSSAYW